MITEIKQFLTDKGYLEVDTPLLCRAAGTHPELRLFKTSFNSLKNPLYLQSSPESCMKRLLAAGFGSIFQICKAFRNEQEDNLHNPEFTILEWYRPGHNLQSLMDEADELFEKILKVRPAIRKSYKEAFEQVLGINPHRMVKEELSKTLSRLVTKQKKNNLRLMHETELLQFVFDNIVIPKLNRNRMIFIYDFPANQACLSRVKVGEDAVSERFEAYYNGLELANGYFELTDPVEQLSRFKEESKKRKRAGLEKLPIDIRLIKALEKGIPNCAGVAIGIDRLAMLYCNSKRIQDVVPFTIERA